MTIKRTNTNLANNGTINGTINDTINKREQMILTLLKSNEGLSAVSIANKLDIGLRTLMRLLKNLSDNDIIEHRGSKKTGGYFKKISGFRRSNNSIPFQDILYSRYTTYNIRF